MYRDSYFDKYNLGQNNTLTEFSKRLRAVRKEKGVSQERVSEELGLAKCTYGTYENSKYIPDADTVAHLADYFNVSADFLLGLTDDVHPKNKENMYNATFSPRCKHKLLDIIKDKDLKQTFELLLENKHFEELLRYMHIYLVFSAKLPKGLIEERKFAYDRATKLNLSMNYYILGEDYSEQEIKVSYLYNSLTIDKFKNILKDLSQIGLINFECEMVKIIQAEEARIQTMYNTNSDREETPIDNNAQSEED